MGVNEIATTKDMVAKKMTLIISKLDTQFIDYMFNNTIKTAATNNINCANKLVINRK